MCHTCQQFHEANHHGLNCVLAVVHEDQKQRLDELKTVTVDPPALPSTGQLKSPSEAREGQCRPNKQCWPTAVCPRLRSAAGAPLAQEEHFVALSRLRWGSAGLQSSQRS